MTPEEVKRRQDAMAKNNALLFYQEQKAKRVKKIKSKAYHRHMKKKADKAKAALDANDLDDPEELQARSLFLLLSLCMGSITHLMRFLHGMCAVSRGGKWVLPRPCLSGILSFVHA